MRTFGSIRNAIAAFTTAVVLFATTIGQAQSPAAVPPDGGSSPIAGSTPPAASPSSGANDVPALASPRLPIVNMQESRLGPGGPAVAGTVPPSTAGRPAYKLLRYEEDWSSLKDPAKRTEFWDPLKYIPLGTPDGYSLTLGGDVRQWFESFHDDSFGLGPGNAQGYNTYFLQRYMLYGDLHLGPNLRVFAQSVSGFEDGRIGGPRPDIDRNMFDAHQGFVDWKWNLGETDSVAWRLGRQEFEYGSGRLIDVREGPNLRLSFDAARFLSKVGDWSVDGWWAKPVRNKPGTFDDEPNPDVSFWGVYGVRPVADGARLNFDAYYLGFENKAARFDQGAGYELRHTVGTRVWGRPKPWEYNLEYAYQFGTFASGTISAFTAANAVRYTFDGLPLKPRPGLRFDVASGDRNLASPALNTFNPLFPSGAYFNLANPVGPQNVIDLHPTLDLQLGPKVQLTADWNFFWRQSLNDGAYRLSGQLFASGRDSRARYIGSSPSVTAVWNPVPHVTVLASYVHVFPGPFLKETTPGRASDYFTTWITYKF